MPDPENPPKQRFPCDPDDLETNGQINEQMLTQKLFSGNVFWRGEKTGANKVWRGFQGNCRGNTKPVPAKIMSGHRHRKPGLRNGRT